MGSAPHADEEVVDGGAIAAAVIVAAGGSDVLVILPGLCGVIMEAAFNHPEALGGIDPDMILEILYDLHEPVADIIHIGHKHQEAQPVGVVVFQELVQMIVPVLFSTPSTRSASQIVQGTAGKLRMSRSSSPSELPPPPMPRRV